jgi:hypothetical protein
VQHDLVDRAREIFGYFLAKKRDLGARREFARSMIGFDFAAQDAHERRFARAIAPEQADALARLDLERDTIEQRRPAESNGKIVDSDKGHREALRSYESTIVGAALSVGCVEAWRDMPTLLGFWCVSRTRHTVPLGDILPCGVGAAFAFQGEPDGGSGCRLLPRQGGTINGIRRNGGRVDQ